MSETMQDINSRVWIESAIPPQHSAAATITGTTMDRQTTGSEQGFDSCVILLRSGTTTGTPSSFTIDSQLQDSADDSSWSNVATSAVNAAVTHTQITAASTSRRLAINLRPLRRYVRLVVTVAFSGGTSPTVGVGATFCFGGARKIPVTSITA
jgi:hypothetical protein